jgi:hypothetical protein
MELILLTQPLVDAGDGLIAATPNFTFVQDRAGTVHNLHDPLQTTNRQAFLDGLASRIAATE